MGSEPPTVDGINIEVAKVVPSGLVYTPTHVGLSLVDSEGKAFRLWENVSNAERIREQIRIGLNDIIGLVSQHGPAPMTVAAPVDVFVPRSYDILMSPDQDSFLVRFESIEIGRQFNMALSMAQMQEVVTTFSDALEKIASVKAQKKN